MDRCSLHRADGEHPKHGTWTISQPMQSDCTGRGTEGHRRLDREHLQARTENRVRKTEKGKMSLHNFRLEHFTDHMKNEPHQYEKVALQDPHWSANRSQHILNLQRA